MTEHFASGAALPLALQAKDAAAGVTHGVSARAHERMPWYMASFFTLRKLRGNAVIVDAIHAMTDKARAAVLGV